MILTVVIVLTHDLLLYVTYLYIVWRDSWHHSRLAYLGGIQRNHIQRASRCSLQHWFAVNPCYHWSLFSHGLVEGCRVDGCLSWHVPGNTLGGVFFGGQSVAKLLNQHKSTIFRHTQPSLTSFGLCTTICWLHSCFTFLCLQFVKGTSCPYFFRP